MGAELIDGIQGRYFASVLLPIAAFFAITFPSKENNPVLSCFTILFSVIILSDTVYRLYSSFFV